MCCGFLLGKGDKNAANQAAVHMMSVSCHCFHPLQQFMSGVLCLCVLQAGQGG